MLCDRDKEPHSRSRHRLFSCNICNMEAALAAFQEDEPQSNKPLASYREFWDNLYKGLCL